MNANSPIVVTGAAGFIGSCLVGFLNEKGFNNLILVDDFSRADKQDNLKSKKFSVKIERETFWQWLAENKPKIDFVFTLAQKLIPPNSIIRFTNI